MEHIVTVGMVAWALMGILGVGFVLGVIGVVLYVIASEFNH